MARTKSKTFFEQDYKKYCLNFWIINQNKNEIMPDNNNTEEFLQKLAPCIERGELEAYVEEAARMA